MCYVRLYTTTVHEFKSGERWRLSGISKMPGHSLVCHPGLVTRLLQRARLYISCDLLRIRKSRNDLLFVFFVIFLSFSSSRFSNNMFRSVGFKMILGRKDETDEKSLYIVRAAEKSRSGFRSSVRSTEIKHVVRRRRRVWKYNFLLGIRLYSGEGKKFTTRSDITHASSTVGKSRTWHWNHV